MRKKYKSTNPARRAEHEAARRDALQMFCIGLAVITLVVVDLMVTVRALEMAAW